MDQYLIEACVDSHEGAVRAMQSGASQIELCAHLDQDGLTPPIALVRKVLSDVDIPVKVMIRPRPGDFVFNEQERESMRQSVLACHGCGITRIVTGGLTDEGTLDFALIEHLAQVDDSIRITVHKVIDECRDPIAAVRSLRRFDHVDEVLTSGGAETAIAGAPVIRRMIAAASDDVVVIAAGRITWENIDAVHSAVGGKVYHGRRILQGLS